MVRRYMSGGMGVLLVAISSLTTALAGQNLLDTLGFRRATLVGHSIAGGELTLFANR